MTAAEFQEILWQKAAELYRDMPWRADTRPYYVLVSEIMLQQTQVDRVRPKFAAFIDRFPDEQSLAQATLAQVLELWSGLGYNRRAKFLHDAAKQVVELGKFPDTQQELQRLPGVGPNTAGALQAYAYNQPALFVETNVRTVYFYHFFTEQEQVNDAQVRELLEQTLDREHPREFYWALMDYGAWLKRQGVRVNAMSQHYKKQSPLKGSIREIRGQIVRQLTTGDSTEADLRLSVDFDERFLPALEGLIRDGLVVRSAAGQLHLTK